MGQLSLRSVIDAINELQNVADIDLLRLRVDHINRMLVSLHVPDDIVYIMGSLYDQLSFLVMQKTEEVPLVRGRGRPKYDIPKKQLSFLLDQAFSVPEISRILGVGKRTVERKLSTFGLTVTGECN
jgi:hypothetical protein